MSRIIAFEGIDGSGKTTQVELLRDHLRARGHRVAERSFPVYDSFFGRHIGQALSATRGASATNIDPQSMALWYALDRWHDRESHRAAYADADYLLLNRYSLSNVVYQSLRAGDPDAMAAWVDTLEHDVLALPRPDVYVILETPLAEARDNVSRKGQRDYVEQSHDVYEADGSLQSRASAAYLAMAERRSDIAIVRSHERGRLLEPRTIFEAVLGALRARDIID